jgi:putative transposase
MADEQSMTTSELVRRALLENHGDFLKEAVAVVASQLMEAEITAEIGAGRGEIAPDSRLTYRNGYRSRGWETRVGEIELQISRKRSGGVVFPVVSGAAPAV